MSISQSLKRNENNWWKTNSSRRTMNDHYRKVCPLHKCHKHRWNVLAPLNNLLPVCSQLILTELNGSLTRIRQCGRGTYWEEIFHRGRTELSEKIMGNNDQMLHINGGNSETIKFLKSSTIRIYALQIISHQQQTMYVEMVPQVPSWNCVLGGLCTMWHIRMKASCNSAFW